MRWKIFVYFPSMLFLPPMVHCFKGAYRILLFICIYPCQYAPKYLMSTITYVLLHWCGDNRNNSSSSHNERMTSICALCHLLLIPFLSTSFPLLFLPSCQTIPRVAAKMGKKCKLAILKILGLKDRFVGKSKWMWSTVQPTKLFQIISRKKSSLYTLFVIRSIYPIFGNCSLGSDLRLSFGIKGLRSIMWNLWSHFWNLGSRIPRLWLASVWISGEHRCFSDIVQSYEMRWDGMKWDKMR